MSHPLASRKLLSRSALVALASLTLTLAGCSSQQTSNGGGSSTFPGPNGQGSSSDQGSGNGYFSYAFPTGNRDTSTLLVEAMLPKQVKVDKDTNFNIKVTNLTNEPVRHVRLTTINGEGFQPTGVSGSTTQPSQGNQIVYNVGDLGPKESRTITVTGMGTRVGTVDTCYAVRFEPPTLCTNLEVVNPAIALTVNAPNDADICQDVVYTYTVSNTGTGVAHNVVVQENLPDGLTTTDGKSTVMQNVGDLGQGQSKQVQVHLKPTRTGNFTGQAMAHSDDDNAQPQDTATRIHAPTLTVAVKGGASDYVGKTVPYQITVTNTGDAPARNAMLKTGVNGVGSLMVPNVDSNGTLSLGTIAPGESRTVNATATSNAGGTETVVADATADCAPPASQTAMTQFNTIPAILLETVDEVDPVKVGSNVVYDVKVTNQGTGPDTNIRVTATVPDGEQYISATGATEVTNDGQNLTFGPVPTLAPKESASWKVTVKAVKAGQVQFKTTATSDSVKVPAEKVEPTTLY